MDPRDKAQFTSQIRGCALKLAQDGIGALGSLYDLTAPRLLSYAQALTRNHADAEDAVQAALVRIAMKPRALANAQLPWAYFLKVVRNEALAISRRRKAAQSLAVPRGWDLVVLPDEDVELREAIRQALDKLPLAQAEVIVLKIWEGMTFLEIGEVLGESSNTAASRYRYAIGKLSQLLCQLPRDVLYEK